MSYINTPKKIKELIKKSSINSKEPEKEYNFIVVNGYKVLEHRAVWEKYKGKIPAGFVIHHKNNNKKDNRIENLECLGWKEHMALHKNIRKEEKERLFRETNNFYIQ